MTRRTDRGDAGEPRLLVVGSVNADLVVRVPRHPRPGETVLGGSLAVHPGGKGANQAVAAARLGARLRFAGRIGSDAYGDMLLRALRDDAVDTSLVTVDDGPSGVALITVDANGENTITVAPGANAEFRPEHVTALEPALRAVDVVSLQLEIPLETVAAVMAACAAYGTRVVMNPSPGPWHAPARLLRLCDPLVVNQHEAGPGLLAAPEPDDAGTDARDPEPTAPAPAALPSDSEPTDSEPPPLERARRALLALRRRDAAPRSFVMTLGAAGAAYAEGDDDLVHIPAPQVHAVDTTGAGDAFTGALAWRLASGDNLAAAVALAVRAGTAATTREGAQSSYPHWNDLPNA
ncbi:ribokinase [Yinghuangia seranimata]|uniref:ribokinase n=1 Tax=Yinghuangia seranimata TaxID=408067 RepID=UPI00248CF193|nr:ribokinase [Yinghuangia seranimata]MDI2131006.1 ribokinase [Yinghuangia seranimata]